MTVTVPKGWMTQIAGAYAVFITGPSADEPAAIAFSLSQSVFADTCTGETLVDMDPQPGPTVDDLASALAHLPGVTTTAPTNVAIFGARGKKLMVTAPAASKECQGSSGGYALWRLPLGHIFALAAGERMAIWILDVRGMRLVISEVTGPSTPAKERAGAESILGSIGIPNSH
jgi:hypothetical protein